MTHRFLYWPEDNEEDYCIEECNRGKPKADIPSTFEKIIKVPKMKGEYIRERDNQRREKATSKDC